MLYEWLRRASCTHVLAPSSCCDDCWLATAWSSELACMLALLFVSICLAFRTRSVYLPRACTFTNNMCSCLVATTCWVLFLCAICSAVMSRLACYLFLCVVYGCTLPILHDIYMCAVCFSVICIPVWFPDRFFLCVDCPFYVQYAYLFLCDIYAYLFLFVCYYSVCCVKRIPVCSCVTFRAFLRVSWSCDMFSTLCLSPLWYVFLSALCICVFCVLLYDVCIVHFGVLCLVHSCVLLCSDSVLYVCLCWLIVLDWLIDLSELIELSELIDWLSRFQLPFFVDKVISGGIDIVCPSNWCSFLNSIFRTVSNAYLFSLIASTSLRSNARPSWIDLSHKKI